MDGYITRRLGSRLGYQKEVVELQIRFSFCVRTVHTVRDVYCRFMFYFADSLEPVSGSPERGVRLCLDTIRL